ncbi:MAG: sulfatase [Candidatus Brocadiia bacterium]
MVDRPNVLIINTHDSGRHFGCYGVPTVHTPAIDALADDGVKFTRMFSTSSICSPSRGSLLTGQYPQRNGLIGLAGGCWNWELTEPTRYLSHVMKNAGYRTAQFGIQHETTDLSKLGFEKHDPYLPEEDGPKHAVRVAEGFAEFLRREGKDEEPFYAQIGFFETHTPFLRGPIEADDEHGVWIPPYCEPGKENRWHGMPHPGDEKLRDHAAELQGSVRHVDAAVEIILDALREVGLEKDSLVLFTTDHGPELPRAKWTMLDAGTGVAFILRWPGGGLTGGQECDHLLSNVDFLPTLAELLDLPIQHEMDGTSFASVLEDPIVSDQPVRECVFALFVNAATYSARTERYRLVRNFKEGYEPRGDACGPRRLWPVQRLYDLSNDPLQERNLVEDPVCGDVLEEMNDRFWGWLEEIDAPILNGPVRTPYYGLAMEDYRERKGFGPSDDIGRCDGGSSLGS